MNASKSDLLQIYDQLLIAYGMDNLPFDEEASRVAFEAAWEAGWISPLYPSATKEAAFTLTTTNKRQTGLTGRFDKLMDQIADEAEEDIRCIGAELPCSVLLRAAPHAYANGYVLSVREGAIIVLNQGLLDMIYQVAKVFILSFDWLKVEHEGFDATKSLGEQLGYENYGWTVDRSLNALAQIFGAYIRHGGVSGAPRQQLPTGRRATQLGTIVHYAERFLALHEYAHILLAHSGPAAVSEALSNVDRQKREVDADQLAASILIRSANLVGTGSDQFDPNARIAGMMLLFACNLFHDTAKDGLSAYGLESIDTHPTATCRAEAVLKFLERYGANFMTFGRILWGWAWHSAIEVANRVHLRQSPG